MYVYAHVVNEIIKRMNFVKYSTKVLSQHNHFCMTPESFVCEGWKGNMNVLYAYVINEIMKGMNVVKYCTKILSQHNHISIMIEWFLEKIFYFILWKLRNVSTEVFFIDFHWSSIQEVQPQFRKSKWLPEASVEKQPR